MKTIPLALTRPVLVLLLACLPLRAEDEIEKAFRDALYAEEVKGDTEAALKAYQEVGQKFETQRDMAATALFRQAECLRKLGRKDEAAALYQKVLAQYGDKERVAKLSRENLAALGMTPAAVPGTAAASPQDTADVARLEKLLKDSPDLINATDASNPLAAAAEEGQVALVDYLLGKGARVDTLVDGKAALHRAAEAGHLTVCQKLIEKGVDINLKTANDATALLHALDKGRVSVAELLLDRQADANAGKLHVATPAKYETQGQQHVRTQPSRSQTHYTLSLALARGVPAPLVLRLIAAGADPAAAYEETEDNNAPRKTAPLSYAIKMRSTEVLAALLAKGVPPDQPVDNDEWAMALAMRKATPTSPDATDDAVVELLRKHGAKLSRREVTLLAVTGGHTGYIRAAVQEGAEKNLLREAVAAKQTGSVKTLLELGADPAKQTEYGGDAMLEAINQSNEEMMGLLKEAGYPAKERLMAMTRAAAWQAAALYRKPAPNARAIYDRLAAEARAAGVLEEALTTALNSSFQYGDPQNVVDTATFLEWGANAAKSAEVAKILQEEQNKKYGLERKDYLPLWKSIRIFHNPDLTSAVWASRGPSVREQVTAGSVDFSNFNFFAQNQHFRPFFRAVISEKGIVPPGTLGRFLAVSGLTSEINDLTSLVIYRLDADRKLQELKVDFAAIANTGDAAQDIPLQWGDVVEIPPARPVARDTDSQAEAVSRQRSEAVAGFIHKFYAENEVRLTIGDSEVIASADNGQGPVLRLQATDNLLTMAGLPAVFEPLPGIEFMRAGESQFQSLPWRQGFPAVVAHWTNPHGDRVRLVPPAREPALNDMALRRAVTFAESESGPYLRTTGGGVDAFPWDQGLRDDLAVDRKVHGAGGVTTVRRIRDVLLMLHGPNHLGFGPVDWTAAKLKIAKQEGWEIMPLSNASLDDAVLPGVIFILPALDPSSPVPPDTFDYAACAMEVEVTPGDLPPFQLRFQPPVSELKRIGDQWVWWWKRKEGDSPCAWPDLYTLLGSAPALKDWPHYEGEITLKSDRKVSFDKASLQNLGGIWLQPDWKGIRLTRKEAAQPNTPVATPAPVSPSPGPPTRKRVVLPTPQQ
jgi:ankyrin repeat protein